LGRVPALLRVRITTSISKPFYQYRRDHILLINFVYVILFSREIDVSPEDSPLDIFERTRGVKGRRPRRFSDTSRRELLRLLLLREAEQGVKGERLYRRLPVRGESPSPLRSKGYEEETGE
jgi:hypothetical protein